MANPLFELLGRYMGNRMASDQPMLPNVSLPTLPSLGGSPTPAPSPTPEPMMSMPQPTPSVPPESMSLPMPAQAPTKGMDYGDTFLRTPMNETNAKAAEEIRNLLYPEPKAPIMSEMQPEQAKKVDEMVAKKELEKSTVSKTPVTSKAAKAKPTSEADALKEMEDEVGEPAKDKESSTLEKLLKQFSEPDKELNDALAQRKKDLGMASIMKAAARIGTALSTQGNKTLEQVSPGAFSDFEKQAMLPVEDIKLKRQAKDEDIKRRQNILSAANSELDLQSQEAKRDPQSEVSQMYRQVIGQAMPELKIPPNISAMELEKLVGPLQNAANMKLAMESKKEVAAANAELRQRAADERKERQDQRIQDNTFKEEERYQNQLSKIDAKNREATKYMDEGMAMADQATKNPQSAMNLARSVIKAVEGAGARVSDKDFTTAVGDASVAGSLMNTFNKLKSGTIRGITKDQVIEMLNASREIQVKKYNEAVKTEVERYSKRAKISPEQAAELGVVPKQVLTDQSETVRIKLPDGREGTIPRASLEEAKKRGAKEI